MNEKIAVSFCDKEERIQFFKLCDSENLKWNSGRKASDFVYFDISKTVVCNYLGIFSLTYSDKFSHEKEYGYKTVPASEFLTPNNQTDIRITSHGRTTVCLKYENGKVAARGVARCNPADEWDSNYGANLAFDRMLFEEHKKQNIKKVWDYVGKKINPLNCRCETTPSGHTDGDAVDAMLPKEPKVKTLKDGTKIVKCEKYEVGDLILLKKSKIPRSYKRICTIRNVCESFGERSYSFSFVKDDGNTFKSNIWWNQGRIKGKIIND